MCIMDNAKLKSKAIKSLSKNLSTFAWASVILLVLQSACYLTAHLSHMDLVMGILLLIVEGLFMPGLTIMAIKAATNKKVLIEDFFVNTDKFFKYIGLSIIVSAIIFLLGLLEGIAFKSLIAIMFYHTEINLILSIFMIALGLILAVSILLVALYILVSFSQAFFIVCEEPKLTIRQMLSKSFDMMEGHIVDYCYLILSFLGWIILGMLTLGILYVLVIPYMLIAEANFYEELKKEYKKYTGTKEPEQIINNKDMEKE